MYTLPLTVVRVKICNTFWEKEKKLSQRLLQPKTTISKTIKTSLLANKAEGHGFQNQFVDNKPFHNPNGILSLRELEIIVSFRKKPNTLAFMDEVYSKLVFKRESMFWWLHWLRRWCGWLSAYLWSRMWEWHCSTASSTSAMFLLSRQENHNIKVNESNMQSQVMPRMTIKHNDQSVTIEICN